MSRRAAIVLAVAASAALAAPAAASSASSSGAKYFSGLALGQSADAGIPDFCGGRQHIQLVVADQIQPPPSDRDRIVVTQVEKGVDVLIYPHGASPTAFDAMAHLSTFLAMAGRPACPTLATWPVLSTNVDGLRFDKGADGKLHASYHGVGH